MAKTDFEIFNDYCEIDNIPDEYRIKYKKEIKSEYRFQRYVLSVRIEEFKTAFKNNLPSWLRRLI